MNNLLENNFYVYCHQKKDDGKCFYIGKGKGKRAYSKHNRNKHWNNIVNKHGGFDVVILVNNITEEKAFELETDLISQIGLKNLCNMTNGGEGASGYKHTEENRRKHSESLKGKFVGVEHHMWGKSHSEETRNKMSEAHTGKHTGDNNSMFGKFGKANPKSRSVSQFTPQREFIRSWDSISDIKRELQINHPHISQCCRGKRKSAGGFIWEYNNNLLN